MPYCKECGNFVEISGNLCSNCQNQAVSNEIPIIKPKKKARSRPLTLSRGLKYPWSIIFVIILILVLNLDRIGLDISVWIDWRSIEDFLILIIPLIIGISAVNKEGSNLIATIGFIILIGYVISFVLGIFAIFTWIFGFLT